MREKIARGLRGEGATNFLASVAAIVMGLLVGLVILLFSNPARAFGAFGAILTGGFSSMQNLGQVLYFATPIIMTGLSVGFANKTGLFNIGASGQFITGAYTAILIGVRASAVPGPARIVLMLLAAAAAGALWGAVPGLLKALCNVNEVISCIMMNYIGMYLVNYLVVNTVYDRLKNQSMRVPSAAYLPKLGLDLIFRDGARSSSANSGIFVAVLAGAAIWVALSKTRFGYELKAVGLNRDAAQYAGINENRGIVLSMLIAGAVSGIGGALLYMAGSGNGIDVVDVLAAEGFNGIPVALLGFSNPIGIIFSGLFIGYLTVGGFNMQLFDFAPQVIEIITAVIIYFSAFALLVRGFLERLRQKRAAGGNGAHGKGAKGR